MVDSTRCSTSAERPPARRARDRRTRAAFACAVLALALAGCGKNSSSLVLIPTGIRPVAGPPAGSVSGYLFFAPDVMPDLAAPPYPPAAVELLQDGALVRRDTLSRTSRRFTLSQVPPGVYQVLVHSRIFLDHTAEVAVREQGVDAGNFVLSLDSDSLNTINVFLMGDIPGFGVDQVLTFESALDQNALGVWTYPNALYPAATIPAGTYRFKLVTDVSSDPSHLIGWGGSDTDTLRVPFTWLPVRFGSGPASDLIVTFPATGPYAFVLDERRQTLDILPAPSGPHDVRGTTGLRLAHRMR